MSWSEKDLFEVELLEPSTEESVIARPARLPGKTEPLPNEVLASWLLRYAEPFELSPEELLRRSSDAGPTDIGDWWRHPKPELIERLAEVTGADPMAIVQMTLWPGNKSTDDPRERFSALNFRAGGISLGRQRRMAVCPLCLSEDAVPYVRRDWTTGWASVCPDHALMLVGTCPECGYKLRLPSLSSQETLAPHRCARCNFLLAKAWPCEAHEVAVALQRQIRSAHDSGAFILTDGTVLQWPIAMALFDLLLGAIWIETRQPLRRQLFDRIENDFGRGVLSPDIFGNYGGLLILAWMLEEWPDRMRTALAIVRGARPRRQIERWRHLDDRTQRVLLDLLLEVWPDWKHPENRGWWRTWIERLPETADELRARAAVDRFQHRRARLRALADVRDGMPVELAAKAAGVTPRTLYLWLKRGAVGGLEVALDRQRGVLNQAQAIEIAEWIGQAPTNQARWRADRVKNEVFRRFGVEISLTVAYRLLRRHGPWRRRGDTHRPRQHLAA